MRFIVSQIINLLKKVTIKLLTKSTLALSVLGLLLSCSAERKNLISKTFHNTTARYNAYYYAKEKINEIEAGLWEQNENDYNHVLKLYPKIDTSIASGYADKVEESVKMASLAIQRHKNSKWVDDSYILIGRARYLSVDYVNSIETFKFVNTKSEDPNAKHEALARLIRTFTDYEEYNNAIAVSDYLKKEKLNRNNQKILYLNRANFYQVKGEDARMVENLSKAVPLMKRKEGKARVYFIIGQIYQKLGQNEDSYRNYRKCVAANPDYELSFYAKLNMTQVSKVSSYSDVKTARRLFKKLLRDKKNKDFKDKIYYEMAEFESKQGNLDEAIEFYNSSVQSSIDNERQKGQSYLRLGQVYYDSLSKYELAKAYYDSTVLVLPKDYEGYEQIKARQSILADFVKQLNTIEEQDSLLVLSGMDSVQQMAIIENILDEQERLRKEEEKRQRKLNRQQNSGFSGSSFDADRSRGGTSNWYFENPTSVSRGQSEFKRKWGNRELEDNWRRADKVVLGSTGTDDLPDEGLEENGIGAEAVPEKSEEELRAEEAQALYAQIPRSEEEKKVALDKIEEAHYNLGKIYHFNLMEDPNAVVTFDTLLERFPATEYEPEVLYLLYLISKELENGKAESYKSAIIKKYPYTTYAKLLSNPNYTEESTAANEQLKKIYKSAYQNYRTNDYDTAVMKIHAGLKQYPDATFAPKLKLLEILITGKTEDEAQYKYELEQFIKENPDSDITPYASVLLQAAQDFKANQNKAKGPRYVPYFEQVHYFVLVYEADNEATDKITEILDSFNGSNFEEAKLNTGNLSLNDKQSIVLVSELAGISSAIQYFDQLEALNLFGYELSDIKMHKFVISKDNFGIFYESGDINSYLKFFEKHYQNRN